MTTVLESYKDSNGIHADIKQDKYSRSLRLIVYSVYDGCLADVMHQDTFATVTNARRAVRRHLTAPIERS